MNGQKNKVKTLKFLFISLNIIFTLVVLLSPVYSNALQRRVQTFEVESITNKVDSILEDYEQKSDKIPNFVYTKNIELIIVEGDTLVYTSNGLADLDQANELFNRGYVYKGVKNVGSYTYWICIFETGIENAFNSLILGLLVILEIYILLNTIISYVFLETAIKPLTRISRLVNSMKTNKQFEENEELDAISNEVAEVINNFRFNLFTSNKKLYQVEHVLERQNNLMLEQNNHLKTVLHDVKTPLAAIRTSSYVLSTNKGLDDKGQELSRLIEDSATTAHDYINETLRTVIDNLTDVYSSVEQINVADEIMEIINSNQLFIENKHLDFVCVLPETIVETNKLKFKQILTNLIFNSILYSKRDKQINIKLTTENLKISNTVDQNSSSGTGFGLNRVQEVVEELGFIFETNENDKEFTVTLSFKEDK